MAVYAEPKWEAPTKTEKQGKYERVLEPLMEKPDTWAKVGDYKSDNSAYQAALNLRHGRYSIPGSPEEWEFVSDDTAVFAKYIGK